MFSCEFCEIFHKTFFKEPFERLLLHKHSFRLLSHNDLSPFQKRCYTYCPAEYFLVLICKLRTRVSSIFQTFSQKPIFKPFEHLRWRFFCKNKIRLQNVLKTSWRCLEDTFATRLEEVLKTSWRRLENFLETSWRRFCKNLWRRLWNVWKTSRRRMTNISILIFTKTSWKRLKHVFWRHRTKANIFVLIKTSWNIHEDVFWRRRRKTPSRRL